MSSKDKPLASAEQGQLDAILRNAQKAVSQSDFKPAIEYFKQALSYKPNDVLILNNLGVLSFKLRELDEARHFLEAALKQKPGYVDALYNLGRVYDALGLGPKGEEVLARLLQIEPAHDKARDLLQKLQSVQESSSSLNILFVQEAPCIRNYKMATALRARGHRVSLAYTKARLSQMYPGLSDDTYSECIHIQSHRQLWDLSAHYDVVHCHNEPDVLTVAAFAGQAPVVHDTHDLISLRAGGDANLAFFEGLANRGAQGRVYTTPYQLNEAQKLYGVTGPSLVLYNYASKGDLPHALLPKLSASDGKTHIVYEGGIGGPAHRDFMDLFLDLASEAIQIHIYPAHYNEQMHGFFNGQKNIHYHRPASPKEIVGLMSQYDAGIIPFNLEKGNKRFLDSTIANKLFEYLAAGLPVVASPLQSYVDYFNENPVGFVYHSAADIRNRLKELVSIPDRVDLSKYVRTYESEVERLEVFYRGIIFQQQSQDKSGAKTAAGSCRICGAQTLEVIKVQQPFNVLRCGSCGVSFADPIPTDQFLRQWYSEEEKKKRWNQDLSLAIAANHEQNQEAYEIYWELINRHLEIKKGQQVLEIGCYDGLFLKRFQEAGCESVGIDLNEGFVAHGREQYGLDLRHGTVADQAFDDEQFDLIVFNQVLEHLGEPMPFMKELRRILKSDGHIFFNVPNAGALTYELENEFGGNRLQNRFIDLPNHLFNYTSESIGALLRRTGWSMEHLNTYQPEGGADVWLKNRKALPQDLEALLGELTGPSTQAGLDELKSYLEKRVLLAVHQELRPILKRLNRLNGLAVVARKSDVLPAEHEIPPAQREKADNLSEPTFFAPLILQRTQFRPLLNLDKTQWLSAEQLQQMQNHFLQILVRDAAVNVPYYQSLFRRHGIDAQAVRSIEDLRALPIMNKETFHEAGASLRHRHFEQLEKHYTATGGSSGKTLKYFVPPEVYYYGFGCRNRGFSWSGMDINKDRVAFLAGGSLGVTNKIELAGNVLKVPATGITDKSDLDRYYEALSEFNPDYMRAYPSALDLFCRYLEETGKKLSLKSVVTTSEMLFDHQRERIERVLGCRVFNEYGAYDGGAGAFECGKGHLHLQMERGIVEILDDLGRPVQAGEAGRIVTTDLHNYLMPFIRYEVGDYAVRSGDVCECGRGLVLLKRLVGRSSDHITLHDGTLISGEAAVHLFNKVLQEQKAGVEQFQLVQKKNKDLDVQVVLEPGSRIEDLDGIRQQLSNHFKELALHFTPVKCIESTRSGKLRFVISEIEQAQIQAPEIVIKKSKPRVLHIGGAHSVHVADIVKELDSLGYEQSVFSYSPVAKAITPDHIPVYSFPYREYRSPDWESVKAEEKVKTNLGIIIEREKPDIVHGHSLTYSSVPVWMAREYYNIPTVVTPWSKAAGHIEDPKVREWTQKCISSSDLFMHGIPYGFREFQKLFKDLGDEKHVAFRPLIDLSPYEAPRQIKDKPKILSARVMGKFYRQDLLIKALPSIIAKYPETEVTLIIGQNVEQGRPYFDEMIRLAQDLGVDDHCNFIGRSLSQDEFADLIKSHNIVYAIATHDGGNAGTVVQAVYSGAVTLVRDTEYLDGIIEHDVNGLRIEVTETAVREALEYAAENLTLLQERFIKNNRSFIKWGKDNMMKNLLACYDRLAQMKSNK